MNRKNIYEDESDVASWIYFKLERSDESWISRPHFHGAVELCIPLHGPNGLCVNGDWFNMQENEIAFVNSFEIHYFDITKDSERIALVLGQDMLEDFYKVYKNGNLRPRLPQRMQNLEENKKIVSFILDWKEKFDGCNELENRGYINLLLGRLTSVYGVQYDDEKTDNLALDILKYINNNFKEPISLEGLSKKFGYSRNTISRVMHSLLGQDLRTYINKLRIQHANRLMRDNPKMTVAEASFESGFNSLNTYYRADSRKFESWPTIKNNKGEK